MRRGGSTGTGAEDEAEASVLLLEVPPKEKTRYSVGGGRIRGLKGSRMTEVQIRGSASQAWGLSQVAS